MNRFETNLSTYFDFFKNLKAIPFHNQLLTMAIVGIGGILAILNALVGAHDQFVQESFTWIYSHTDSDGDSQSPLINSLIGSGALGAMVWFLMRQRKHFGAHAFDRA